MSTDTERAGVVNAREPEPTSRSLLDKWKLINRINASYTLTSSAKVVAVNLMWRMNCRWETCFPKQETVSEDTGLSRRAVQDALVQLREDGWLTWKRDHARAVHVYRFVWDRGSTPFDGTPLDDEPQEPANSAPVIDRADDERGAKSALRAGAKSAPLEQGKGLTREVSSLSQAAPSKESERPKGKSPSSADKPQPQEGSAEWLKDEVWLRRGMQFKEAFYPAMSQAAFKKRLGEVCRRESWDLRKVLAAMCATLEAGPGGDAFEYMAGVLRKPAPSAEEPRLRGPI